MLLIFFVTYNQMLCIAYVAKAKKMSQKGFSNTSYAQHLIKYHQNM